MDIATGSDVTFVVRRYSAVVPSYRFRCNLGDGRRHRHRAREAGRRDGACNASLLCFCMLPMAVTRS